MVSVKGRTRGCPKCCCSDCSERPDAEAAQCCMCVCAEMTATLSVSDTGTGTSDPPGPCDASCNCTGAAEGECSCVSSDGELGWDKSKCAWVGNVSCAGLIVDVEVAVKRCSDTCYLCVKSTCLNLVGDCDTGTASCWTITNCGEYKAGCVGRDTGTADQVMSIELTDDFSGCGDLNCGTATLTITCTDYINPQPDPPICCDCDCMCECVCLSYTEDGCTESVQACWNGTSFTGTFSGDCPWGSQSVTITLVEQDGNCYWSLAVSRGTPDDPLQPAGCPSPNVSWELSNPTASVGMVCGSCGAGICCDRDLPTQLAARICSECTNTCVTLNLVSSTSEETLWSSDTITLECPDEGDSARPCIAFSAKIEFACIIIGGSTIWEIRLYCGSTLKDTAIAIVQCEPFCAEGTVGNIDADCLATVCGDTYGVCVSEAVCA